MKVKTSLSKAEVTHIHLAADYQVLISRLMRQHDYSQADVCRELGVYPSRLSDILRGGKNGIPNPTLKTIGKLAAVFDEDISIMESSFYDAQLKAAYQRGKADIIEKLELFVDKACNVRDALGE